MVDILAFPWLFTVSLKLFPSVQFLYRLFLHKTCRFQDWVDSSFRERKRESESERGRQERREKERGREKREEERETD